MAKDPTLPAPDREPGPAHNWPSEKTRVFLRGLKWTLFPKTRKALTPDRPKESCTAGTADITYVGHASLLVQTSNFCFLTDPVLSTRIFGIKRLVEPAYSHRNLPRIDLALVSHGHLDHCDVPTLRKIAPSRGTITSRGIADLVPSHHKTRELAWWESCEVGPATVTSVPSKHWGRRWLRKDQRGYGGFVVSVDGVTIYFAGDTAYFGGFREIGKRFKIDIALLPIGAYSPREFQRNHISPIDAVQAFEDLGARTLIPYHWGTFVLSYEPVHEPPALLARTAAERGLTDHVRILRHGECMRFDTRSMNRVSTSSGRTHESTRRVGELPQDI